MEFESPGGGEYGKHRYVFVNISKLFVKQDSFYFDTQPSDKST